MNNRTTLDMNYQPPEKDPHEQGTALWDELRAQHMLALDELRHTRQECAIKDGRIGDLQSDIERLNKLLEASRNESVSLRATMQNMAATLITGLRKAEDERIKADPYAPPAEKTPGGELSGEDQGTIEDLVSRLGAANTGREPITNR